jgi:hypothetical protein
MRKMLNKLLISMTCGLALLLVSCGAQCPEDSLTYLSIGEISQTRVDESSTADSTSREVRTFLGLARKSVAFDQIIEGEICGDTWRGTVYVTCNIAIPAWDANPFFLEECPVSIEPESVVYVEAHGDKAYNEGCSCHE